MEGVIPISFNLGDVIGNIPRQIQQTLTPFLSLIVAGLRRQTVQVAVMGIATITLLTLILRELRSPPAWVLPVDVINLGFLEVLGIISSVLLLLIFLKLLDVCRLLAGTNHLLRWVEIELQKLHADLVLIHVTLIGMFSRLVTVLFAILAQFQLGISLRGELTITFDVGPGLGGIDLWELIEQFALLALAAGTLAVALGLLTLPMLIAAAAVAVLAAAVALLAGALQLMPDNITEIVNALIKLGIGMIVLGLAITAAALSGQLLPIALGLGAIAFFMLLLAGALQLMPDNLDSIVDPLLKLGLGFIVLGGAIALLDQDKFLQVALGFLVLAGFMILLGLALMLFDENTLKAIPSLNELFKGLIELGNAINEFSEDDLKKIAMGLGGIVFFMLGLGLALKLFSADTLGALEGLNGLFEALTNLATSIVAFSDDELMRIALGFGGIVLFVGLLGLAMQFLNADTLEALPGLSELFDTLINLAQSIVEFDTDQLLMIAAGFAGIVFFVAGLGAALSFFQEGITQAGPALAQLVEALAQLTGTLATLDVGQLFIMGIALAMLAAFVFVLSAALVIATPGLEALTTALNAVKAILDGVAAAASAAASAITSIPSSLPDISFPSFADGGVMPNTGFAFLHEGERVLNPSETRAFDQDRQGALAAGATATTAGPVDQSLNVGGVTVNVSANSVDSESIEGLGDEIVQRLQERLAQLQNEQSFRTGVRTEAIA